MLRDFHHYIIKIYNQIFYDTIYMMQDDRLKLLIIFITSFVIIMHIHITIIMSNRMNPLLRLHLRMHKYYNIDIVHHFPQQRMYGDVYKGIDL